VFEYASRRLSRVRQPERSRIAANVAHAGEENFLYARYVLDEILSRPGGVDTRVTIKDLPAGLDAVYREFLNRELATNEATWEERFRPLLGAVLSRLDHDELVDVERWSGRDELCYALEAPVWDRFESFAGQPLIAGSGIWTTADRRVVIEGRHGEKRFEELV
jgi:hypothetical protein